MPRYPTEHKKATRRRIVAVADAVITARGVEAATLEAVMGAAGLTVGAFYAHFESKDALVEAALVAGIERSIVNLTAGLDGEPPGRFATALIGRYLAQAEAANLADGCPLTLLLPDLARGDSAWRVAFAERSDGLLATIERRLPAVEGMPARDVAFAVFGALAGGVALARAAATPRGRRRILAATEASLHRFLGL